MKINKKKKFLVKANKKAIQSYNIPIFRNKIFLMIILYYKIIRSKNLILIFNKVLFNLNLKTNCK